MMFVGKQNMVPIEMVYIYIYLHYIYIYIHTYHVIIQNESNRQHTVIHLPILLLGNPSQMVLRA